MQEPYYGILLSSLNRIEVPDTVCQTAAVARSGSVFKLLYNKNFIESLSVDSALLVLKHEMMHLAFKHFYVFETPPKDEAEQNKRNIAADMEVNSYLNFTGVTDLHPVLPSQMGWKNELGTITYYNMLDNLEDSNVNWKAALGAAAGAGQMDDHSKWPQKGDADFEVLGQIVDDMVVLAADEVEKACGTIPGEMSIRIKKLREQKRPKPVADWRRYVRRYIGNEFSEFIRKSKKRESKRFPDAPGNRKQRKSHVLVAIDTSGSVSQPEYEEFFGQLRTLEQAVTFHVVECDTEITKEYDFNGRVPALVHGGGGTSFSPPVDMFRANQKIYDALIYFTDGGAPIPANTPKDTLWVISSQGDHDKNKYKVNGASVVFIPKQK